MGRRYTDSDFYVAPSQAPASRRPPISSVGPIGWMRTNLFSGFWNGVATVITAVIAVAFLWAFLTWSIRDAQWGVVFNNLRLLTSGQYPREEIWRMELTGGILVFLIGLSLGLWGQIARSIWLAVVVTMFVIIVIPIIGSHIDEPTIYTLIEPRKSPSDFVFTGDADQEVSFTIEPLDTVSTFNTSPIGYVQNPSRTEWSTQARAATVGDLDPSTYNLVLTLSLLNASGQPVNTENGSAEIAIAPTSESRTLNVTLPDDGWYVLQVVRDDEANGERNNNEGYAWLKTGGVALFEEGDAAASARAEEYGEAPSVDRGIFPRGNDFRFEGARTVPEFFSLQVAPLAERLAMPFFIGSLLLANGWIIGVLGKREKDIRRAALIAWVLSFPAILLILNGVGWSDSLPKVPTSMWGGLLLTVLLTVVGITASFPLGVALALGRRSDLPAIKWTCTIIIEVVRGVPLITILFMAKLIVPFFWSALSDLDLTIRMMIGLTLFSAAYLAENVRGGLQIVPQGQLEAARALGMNPALTTSLIVLPQALRAVIPAIVGQFISLFKDTSLVALVGVFELVGIVDIIVSGQPVYRPYQREAYIFIAIVYFVISYAMSDVSRRLEATGAGSVRK